MTRRLRTRDGRGRGFVQNHVYIPYTRTDQNKFEILSSLQDGDDAYGRFDDVDSDGFIKVRNSKRQRVNTGGDDNDADTRFSQTPDLDTDADFDSLDMNEKLSTMFITLNSKISHVEQKVDSINKFYGRVQRVETVMNRYNERLKLLVHCS